MRLKRTRKEVQLYLNKPLFELASHSWRKELRVWCLGVNVGEEVIFSLAKKVSKGDFAQFAIEINGERRTQNLPGKIEIERLSAGKDSFYVKVSCK